MSHLATWLRRQRRLIISIVVIGLLVIVLLPQTDTLWRSLDTLSQASARPVLLAILLTIMTYILSGEVYYLLLKHPIALRQVMLVQVATALTSRVVPIGIGTMGLNAIFLRKRQHSLSEALAVVATNNGLGMLGHFCLLSLVALTAPLPSGYDLTPSWSTVYWVLLGIGIVVLVFTASERLRRRSLTAIADLVRAITSYRHQPRQLIIALITSITLSCVYALALVACAQALGVDLPVSKIFLVYTFSLLTGVATPTPGGLVGVEAGLVAGFVAYGVAADTALAIALLYRLITYWLPLIPGFIAFRIVQHKYL
jgi:uncharacterized membrane protein YbhN (UPF0104 family)